MGVTTEVFRLTYEATGLAGMKQAQAELDKIARMSDTAKRRLDAGKITAEEYGQAMDILARKTERAREAMDRFNRSNKGGGFGGGGGSGRGAALGRTGFALANIGQDIAAAGPGAALNNVLNPMVWDDLATSVGGGKTAILGFGVAAAAALAAVAVTAKDLNTELEKGGLAMSDLGDVLGNLPAVESATGKFKELADAIGTMIPEGVKTAAAAVSDFMTTSLVMEGLDAAGLQEAIEKTRREKDAEGARRARTAVMVHAVAKAGGIGPLEGVVDQMNREGGLDNVVKQVKAENDLAARNQAEEEAKQKADLAHKVARQNEVDAAMEKAKAGAIAGVPNAEQQVRSGLAWRLGDGMGADQASSEVADWLAKAIGDALPEADAKAAAGDYVGKHLEGMRAAAADELASSPDAMKMRQLDLMGSMLDLQGAQQMSMFGRGPQTIAAGSFAQSVQDNQKPMLERMKEFVDLARRNLEFQQKIADNTRTNTLVGP